MSDLAALQALFTIARKMAMPSARRARATTKPTQERVNASHPEIGRTSKEIFHPESTYVQTVFGNELVAND
jgi:hypothetical protein